MSDLLNFFGNNDDESPSKIFNNESTKKSIKRPNTLKSKPNASTQNNTAQTPLCAPSNISPLYHFPLLTSLSCSNISDLHNFTLPPENAKGNIEYKRQLLNLTALRKQHLITQLKWRLEEGQGEAVYEIGVEDDGRVSGLEQEELRQSVVNLCSMADTLNASVSLVRECNVGTTKKAVEILIKNMPTQYSAHETRVAILGNMDAGKSTLIGVLTQGILDDGQGKTRLSTFRHIHEVRSGRTSSISCQLLGFDSSHNVTNYYWQKKRLHLRAQEDVVLLSRRLVYLIDLAGCWKYQRTTLFALTSRRPHFVLLVISAAHVLKGTTIHHFKVSEALKLPIAIVITKCDRYSPEMAITELSCWLKQRSPTYDIDIVTSKQQAEKIANQMIMNDGGVSQSTIPVFTASCVSGQSIDIITSFLETISSNIGDDERNNGAMTTTSVLRRTNEERAEVWIDQIHSEVPRVEGLVVAGLVHVGSICENDSMFLGPQKNGRFVPVVVQSIHRNRLQHHKANSSQLASFAVTITEDYPLKHNDDKDGSIIPIVSDYEYPEVQRGMVLLGQEPLDNLHYSVMTCSQRKDDNKCCGHVVWGVVVTDINLLNDEQLSTTDLEEQPSSWIVHCGNVYQRCQMVKQVNIINNDLFENLIQKKVIFRFNPFPQFIHCDDTFVFHRPHRNMKAHGSIKLLLGEYAFQKVHRTSNNVDIGELDNNNNNHKVSCNGFSSSSSSSSSSDDDDDEYVTAPSSPILTR